ncbi:hypothetical protein N0V95_009666 [Ascochyta clinopodiicola]|nr:hypothetical protein N0V95_009666 [Ascochyta clinopodiicola]
MTEAKDTVQVAARNTSDDISSKNISTVAAGDETSSSESKTTSWWRHAVGYIWDTVEGDPEYRRYVTRLDRIFFPTVLLGYFIKYLDQTNYSNAFVSGMKEDLHLYGNERNWLNTWFSLGIMIGSVPAQMSQLSLMYVLRFFIGLFEACSFPGYIAMLGSWYGPKELTKRLAILLQVESMASMFSGYLQGGLHSSMNGRHGLAGWRWLFIMDAVISLPIAIWGFFGLPDRPHNTRAFYFSSEHIKYGIERIEKFGQTEQTKLTWKEVKRVLFSWKIWVFVVPYTMVAACHTATSYFNLWLKASGYSVEKTNYLPTGGNALNIVFTITCGIIADHTGANYGMIVAIQLLMMFSNILLSVWHIPKSALMFAYYLSYCGSAATPILISWATRLNAADASVRQLLVATANVVSYAWVLWVPLVLFPTYDAPKYKYGYQILILFGGLAVASVSVMWYAYRGKEAKL